MSMNQFQVNPNNALAELCRRNFFRFVQEFWGTVISEKPIYNWHIKYLCDELQNIGTRVMKRMPKEYDYYIINVPPGSSKSTIVSEMYPLWCWLTDPTQRFICGSYSNTVAEDLADKAYNIYSSDKFRILFPDLVKNESGGKSNLKNGLQGQRYITSTGAGITGIHAHQKIIDDPMSTQTAASALERERANLWITDTLSRRNVDDNVTVTIIVMQRLHEDDTTGHLLSNKDLNIRHICIPAEIGDNVKPESLKAYYVDGLFDPIRKSRATLQRIKTELGSFGYAGQMLQNPTPLKGGILKKDWFPIIEQPIPQGKAINFQIDPAYTANTANDPTAVVGYYYMNNQLFITSSISVYKEFPDLISWLPGYLRDNGYTDASKVYTEPKASGLSVIQQLKDSTNLNIIASDAPKEDKLTNVNIVSPKIESKRVSLHLGGWNGDFIDQAVGFPKMKHDDELDCLVAIIRRELIKPPVQDLSAIFGGGF